MIAEKFSVLMSLYFKEKPTNLEQCLNSLYNQTLKATEIIIVLDGDITKDLDNVLNKWISLLPIGIVKLDNNVGLGRALKKGMDFCQYSYIARMDTDDICFPNRFERQFEYLSEHNDVDLLGSSIIEFNEDNNERLKKLPTTNDDIRKYSYVKNPFNHMSVVFKKDSILAVGGYRHHLYMEDYNLWIRLISSGYMVHNIPDVLVKARVGKNTLLKRTGLAYIKSEIILFRLKNKCYPSRKVRNLFITLYRSIPRLFPVFLISFIYRLDRNNSIKNY